MTPRRHALTRCKRCNGPVEQLDEDASCFTCGHIEYKTPPLGIPDWRERAAETLIRSNDTKNARKDLNKSEC